MELTQARVCELFDYDDGQLIWRVNKSSSGLAGSIAGCVSTNGYVMTGIDGFRHYVHRLIFLWHHGWTPARVDHIDEDRTNNRIANLRPASNGQNMSNRGAQANNTSGYKGVNWNPKNRKWIAKITVNRRQIYLGSFDTAEDAAIVYAVNAFRYHGEFAKF